MHISGMATVILLVLQFVLAGCAAPHQHPAASDELRPPPVTSASHLTDAEIRTILQDNVGPGQQADGLVVGVVDETGGRIIAAGADGAGRPVDGDTVFSLGSITKVFTVLLLQDMLERGQMSLDDPVQMHLPESIKLPTRGPKQITLFDLATHTSGLPRDGNLDSLAQQTLRHDPGTHYEYSNLGVALLGHAIAHKAAGDYENLLVDRICKPLGMDSTRVTPSPAMRERLSVGHAFPGRPEWSANTPPRMPGAGSLHSSGNDLLRFMSASLGLTPSPLTPLIRKSQSIQQTPSGRKGRLVWFEEAGVLEHSGLVAGYRTNLCLDPARRRGAFVLSNCSSGEIPLSLPKKTLADRSPRPQHVAAIDSALLDGYVGDFDFGRKAQTQLAVRRDGDRLLLQVFRGQPRYPMPFARFEVFPQSDTVFANAWWDQRIEFIHDNTGRAAKVRIDGLTGVRIPTPATDPAPAPIDDFVGEYRARLLGLIPVGPTLHLSRRTDANGDHLMARVSGPPGGGDISGELYPFSQSLVFSPDLQDLSLTFKRNRKQRVTSVVIHFGDRVFRATRATTRSASP
jgi:CubicO group peptidase (beta-lactamase class C family)